MSVARLRADIAGVLSGCPGNGLSCLDRHEAVEYTDRVIEVLRRHLPSLITDAERLRKVEALAAGLQERLTDMGIPGPATAAERCVEQGHFQGLEEALLALRAALK